jgi:hypothetical protein
MVQVNSKARSFFLNKLFLENGKKINNSFIVNIYYARGSIPQTSYISLCIFRMIKKKHHSRLLAFLGRMSSVYSICFVFLCCKFCVYNGTLG